MVLYEDLHNNVLEFNVHDGCNSLLLWAEQSWSKDYTQIGNGHEVLLMVTGHTIKVTQRKGRHSKSKLETWNLTRFEATVPDSFFLTLTKSHMTHHSHNYYLNIQPHLFYPFSGEATPIFFLLCIITEVTLTYMNKQTDKRNK